MTKKKYGLIFALVLPIIGLLAMVINAQIRLWTGTTVVLPIEGYDPRSLLSGHYLAYRLVNTDNVCKSPTAAQANDVYLCLEQKNNQWVATTYLVRTLPQCTLYIKGKCERTNFMAGIERYYVPEQKARSLEAALRQHQGAIELQVDKHGKATVRDLVIVNPQDN